MAVIAIDFDNTIVMGDVALPGAKELIDRLRDKGHKVIIHSCNNPKWIEKVLKDSKIKYDRIWDSTVDVGKPVADIYIDDKGYHHPNNSQWTEEEMGRVCDRLKGLDNRKW